MNMRYASSVALIAIALLSAAPARAQIAEDSPDPAKVRVRLGPLWMSPTIGLTNMGIDNNVFNEPPQKNPKKDFTFTLTPKTSLWLRMGNTWIAGEINEQILWYQTYSSERSASENYIVTWRLPRPWLVVNTNASYTKSRARPGFEIDARVAHKEASYGGSVELRVMSKIFVGVRADRRTFSFDKAVVFQAANLSDGLDRTSTATGLSLRYDLTSLTSLTLKAMRLKDQFKISKLRDSNSTLVSATVTFDPFALIKGKATVGLRTFVPEDPDLPRYQGTTAAVDLFYSLYGTTRFAVKFDRDIQYSYDFNQPYYLQTGVDVSMSQQIFGPVDIVGRVGTQRLDYSDRRGATIDVRDRIDVIHVIGGGVGYRLGRELRLGFNIESDRRISEVESRPYQGLKYGTALTYAF
jgi:hypothetical protein